MLTLWYDEAHVLLRAVLLVQTTTPMGGTQVEAASVLQLYFSPQRVGLFVVTVLSDVPLYTYVRSWTVIDLPVGLRTSSVPPRPYSL